MALPRSNPFAVATLLLLFSLPPAAQESKPEYGIREKEPRTGSAIRRYDVAGSPVAINKRYRELTAEEKALLKSYYVKIGPGDEPPFPIDGLKPVYDAMRKGQRKLLVTGTLILVATVNPAGEVSEVKAIGSPSPEMTEFAASVLFLTRFKPARCEGQPCTMQFPFGLLFKLD